MGCTAGADPFIERHFGDCIYNVRDLVGFCAGMASICCWLVAQLPQLYRNYRRQSAEALSPWFLAEWLLGDTCNLVGALLTGDQLPTVVFTAQYFICVDAVMMIQFTYYLALQRRRERMAAARRHRHGHHRHGHHRDGGRRHHAPPSALPQHGHDSGDEREEQQQGSGEEWGEGRGGPRAADTVAVVVTGGSGAGGGSEIRPTAAAGGSGGGGRAVPVVPAPGGGGRDVAFRPQRALAALGTLLVLGVCLRPAPVAQQLAADAAAAAAGGAPLHRQLLAALVGADGEALGGRGRPPWSYAVGTALGYASSVLYLTSRVSQLWKNHVRQSAEGLAISMFLLAIAANSCYGASILIRSYSWPELRGSLPWLVGSLGTVALDLAIFVQWRVLGAAAADKQHPSDEDEPLLQAA